MIIIVSVALEEIEQVAQLHIWQIMDWLWYQKCQLTGVLANRRNAHGTWPIVVQVRILVCQRLHLVRVEARFVNENVVMGGWNRALTHMLRNEEKVISENRVEERKQNAANIRSFQAFNQEHLLAHLSGSVFARLAINKRVFIRFETTMNMSWYTPCCAP